MSASAASGASPRRGWRHAAVAVASAGALAFALAPRAHGYATIGGAWPSGTIPIQVQLDATAPASSTAFPLRDGATSWNSVAKAAIGDWNTVLANQRCRIVPTESASAASAESDGVNSVIFAKTVYGQTFDSFTLAVTLVDNTDSDGIPTVRIHEADLVVNANRTWNSYRGNIASNPLDLRRVVLHELGHVLGLDHPDQATPPQTVTAIMNSAVSNTETLQSDDISGVTFLYGTPLTGTTLTTQPVSQSANVGGAAAFTIGLNGSTTLPAPNALLSYTWYFKATGATAFEKLFTITDANLRFGTVQLADAGSYYVEVMTPDTMAQSNTVTLTALPVTTTSNTTLLNVSTRGVAGSGSSAMIAGFVVSGSKAKTILLRGIGPSLASYGVTGTLSDPQIVLSNTTTGAVVATSLPIWDQDSTTAPTLRNAMSSVGAFALSAGTRDAVLLVTVPPGSYTAKVASASGTSGTVLAEAYDTTGTSDPTNRLVNISTRGYVGTGDKVLIAGFSVRGPGPHTYVIRVVGTTLANYGVSGTLYDPILTLFDSNGAVLRVDDDWDSPLTAQPALKAAFQQVGAFALTDRKESAMLVTLPPGTYTAQASGNDNDGTTSPTGNALIEIYELP